MDRDFLKIGNHKRILNLYSTFLEPNELAKIDSEIRKHTRMMFELATAHFLFATSIKKREWRQRVSRLYYASYNASKAVRFDADGNHSTDVNDHSKVGMLPDGFPTRSKYENELKNLRTDRNLCDYDHTANLSELISKPNEYEILVLSFLRDCHDHLTARGNGLGAKL